MSNRHLALHAEARLTAQHPLLGTMVNIFERILGQVPIAGTDSFFDLGGDSILALSLMQEIEHVTGRRLPVTTIYDASTPAAMAELLVAENVPPPRITSLVLLRPGHGKPVFLMHGLGGLAMELRNLAQLIDVDVPIYGIEALGIDGASVPIERVEDMAEFYLAQVREVQPEGPYRLIGFSFGGLVTLEMAQRLVRAGDRVAFLSMLDTFPHTRYWPLLRRGEAWVRQFGSMISLELWPRVLRHHLRVLQPMAPARRVVYVADRLHRASRLPFSILRSGMFLKRFIDRAILPVAPALVIPQAVRRVQAAGYIGFLQYRPSRYTGQVTYIKAAHEKRIPFDARSLWGRFAPNMTVHTIPGDHESLVRGAVEPLAACISAALRASGAGRVDDV
jgi:acetoacetyl-CoA synthetase